MTRSGARQPAYGVPRNGSAGSGRRLRVRARGIGIGIGRAGGDRTRVGCLGEASLPELCGHERRFLSGKREGG